MTRSWLTVAALATTILWTVAGAPDETPARRSREIFDARMEFLMAYVPEEMTPRLPSLPRTPFPPSNEQ